MGETLKIVLADGSKIVVDKVYHISIQFCKQVRLAVLYHIVEYLSSPLILDMQWWRGTNPTIRWLAHEVDLQYGQSIVVLKEQTQEKQLLTVQLCSDKAGIKAI